MGSSSRCFADVSFLLLLPPPGAGAVAGWAVEGLEGLSGLTQAAAAKALLQLALRGLAAAARPAAGPAAGEAGGGTGGGTGGDLGLLLAVATDVREMMNAGGLLACLAPARAPPPYQPRPPLASSPTPGGAPPPTPRSARLPARHASLALPLCLPCRGTG